MRLGALVIASLLIVSSVRGQEEGRREEVAEALGLVELLVARHIATPSRGDLLLAGARAVQRGGNAAPPAKGTLTASDSEDREALSAWLAGLWPEAGSRMERVEAFRRGVFSVLPDRPRALLPNDYRARRQLRGNRYVGVGVALRFDEQLGVPVITGTRAGSPAERAGLKAGDQVVGIDGRATKGLTLPEFIEYSRSGQEGEAVTYTMTREGAWDAREVRMIRAEVPEASVAGARPAKAGRWDYRLNPDSEIAYLRLREIVASTPFELRRLEARLRREGIRALILDLRRTRGEVTRYAAMVADLFLERGEIGRVRRREGTRRFNATRQQRFAGWPLVVLVDRTAQGPVEWLAAALQRHGRARLVGMRTAGYPWEQSLIAMPGGEGGYEFATGRLVMAPQRTFFVDPDHQVAGADGSEGSREAMRDAEVRAIEAARKLLEKRLGAKGRRQEQDGR